MIKLSGLSPCLLYSAFYVNSVVCRLLSVSYQEFKQQQWLCLKQRAHNPAYTNQPPPPIKMLNLTVGFFSQIHVSDGVIKIILVGIICIAFNLDACKVLFLNYLLIFLNFGKRVFKIIQKFAPSPPTGFSSLVVPLKTLMLWKSIITLFLFSIRRIIFQSAKLMFLSYSFKKNEFVQTIQQFTPLNSDAIAPGYDWCAIEQNKELKD